MSGDLQWLLLRKNNSFIVKGGHGPAFSREKGNLLNRHSHKYSGLTNAQGISMHPTKEGSILITKIKKDVSPHQVASARVPVTLRRGTTARRAAKIAAAETAGKGYRSDLRQAAVARASALVRAQRRSANVPKTRAPKLRGKKARKAAFGQKVGSEEEDVIELD
ncbi:60s ribosomal protein [Dioszegia hungarica]|uniref:60s ribosomal protein n=1 Tax=Dioszegia hungarica TaxID=4972 RepID=A0AA38LWH0_9TREE|nr:60s ribosomal protein [Dioszegia hungarica]KAI9637798.1 60s ribosomal protein [Dioszegia hungarica]